MKCNKITDKSAFKGQCIYDVTSYVQSHTLINRGITTLGGSTVPHCIMSNNKYEAHERAIMGGVYFIASYLTPILLIPVYNRRFLKNKGITKEFDKIAERIIQVPKEYLAKAGNLEEGLKATAKIFDKKNGNTKTTEAFNKIYKRYNDPSKLKEDLLSVHEKVLMTDFITTAAMWSAIPWIATEFTEHRTKRTDFSAGFNLKQNNQEEIEKAQNDKKKKIFWNILFSVIPGVLFSKAVTKGLKCNNISKNSIITNWVSKHPDKFNYTSGTNMSKTIYASIWALSSFPAKIISSRDSNERKDRALRDIGLFTMFFGGDFLLNNILGRLSDRFLGTKIMDTKGENPNFIKSFKLNIKNFQKLENETNISPNVLKRTKTIGACLYWVSLLVNTALIGFLLPKILNKFLRYNINKEDSNQVNKEK